jgi:class 3 adenylate cyclase
MDIPASGRFDAVAVFVDINGFTTMVSAGAGDMVAQFTSDVLAGAVKGVEDSGGEVVAFIGDALLGILPDAHSAVSACARIAKDCDRQCEWISDTQRESPHIWSFAPGGPGLKIAFEWGSIESARIGSRKLGIQSLLIGEPINYASRISGAGEGNRCVCGPAAANLLKAAGYDRLKGPEVHHAKGVSYPYFELDLGDFWLTGKRVSGEDSYLG